MTESERGFQEPKREEAPPLRIDPAPLALGAFALNTFLLSWVNAGMVPQMAIEAAVATAWVFGGFIQVAVGFWELLGGRLFQAVTFGSYGSFWLSFAFFETLYTESLPEDVRGAATALFLAPWAVFTLYMLIGSLRTNLAIVVAFVLVEALLIPTTYGFATGTITGIRIGGWIGVALAIDVWYVAAAEIINHQFGRTILPLGELGSR
jgi:succinate-acetate transporter protein